MYLKFYVRYKQPQNTKCIQPLETDQHLNCTFFLFVRKQFYILFRKKIATSPNCVKKNYFSVKRLICKRLLHFQGEKKSAISIQITSQMMRKKCNLSFQNVYYIVKVYVYCIYMSEKWQ